MEGGPEVSNKQLSHAVIAGAVIGAVAAAAILGILVFLVQRHYIMHRWETSFYL